MTKEEQQNSMIRTIKWINICEPTSRLTDSAWYKYVYVMSRVSEKGFVKDITCYIKTIWQYNKRETQHSVNTNVSRLEHFAADRNESWMFLSTLRDAGLMMAWVTAFSHIYLMCEWGELITLHTSNIPYI